MQHTSRATALVSALAAALAASPMAEAQAPAPAVYAPTSLKAEPGLPRTPDGRPDFQGVVWTTHAFAPLQVMPVLVSPDLVIPEVNARATFDRLLGVFLNNPAIALDPEAPDLMKSSSGFPVVRGERRGRLIVQPADGRLPLTAEARAEVTAAGAALTANAMKAENPEDRMSTERCIQLGGLAPMAMLSPLHPRQFVQTRTHVVIHTEYGDEVRIIPFTDRHGPAALQPPLGDSIARWDGDTLVVETTHNPARDRIRPVIPLGALIVNPQAKVIERFTRLNKDELLYQFTIEDPKVYSAPWLAEYTLHRASYGMHPHACHEGNYGLANILSGAREEEKAAATIAAAP